MIQIENLSKSFGHQAVLRDFSLELPAGWTTVIMGTSGCGKTTLAQILLGLLKPDGGVVNGLAGKRASAVFQEDRLCEQLSARDNIRLVLPKDYPEGKIEQAAKEVDIEETSLRRAAGRLSGGQKRRIAILRAMLAESDFICLDEPFKGLDRDTKARTMDFVRRATAGKTTLLITHDREEAAYFSDQVIELKTIDEN